MKRLKIMLVSALALVAFAFFAFTPIVMAGATETAETSEITSLFDEETTENVSVEEDIENSEIVENTGDYTASYYCQTSENESVRLDFIDESNVKITLFLEEVEMGTLNATYQRVDNIVDLYLANEWFGAFKLKGDGTAIDVSWWEDYYEEDNETDEITGDFESVSPVIDEDFDKYLQPLICAAAGLGGTILIVLLVSWFLKKGKKKIDACLSQIETVSTELKKNYGAVLNLYADVEKAYKELESTPEKIMGVLDLVSEHYCKIIEILGLISVGSSELVRKGVADEVTKKVEEVIDKGVE